MAERAAAAQRRGESKHLAFPMREHHYYVYMMISSSRRALYIGVTNNLERRVFQHKHNELEGFSQQYQAHRLVWFERYSNIHTAIAERAAAAPAAAANRSTLRFKISSVTLCPLW